MRYRVVVQRLALQDLDEAYVWAAERAPETAGRWLRRFQDAIATLEEDAQRQMLAPENGKTRHALRQMLFGKRPFVFRVMFTIDGGTVRVLRILRAQRRFLTRKQIEEAARPDQSNETDV